MLINLENDIHLLTYYEETGVNTIKVPFSYHVKKADSRVSRSEFQLNRLFIRNIEKELQTPTKHFDFYNSSVTS